MNRLLEEINPFEPPAGPRSNAGMDGLWFALTNFAKSQ